MPPRGQFRHEKQTHGETFGVRAGRDRHLYFSSKRIIYAFERTKGERDNGAASLGASTGQSIDANDNRLTQPFDDLLLQFRGMVGVLVEFW